MRLKSVTVDAGRVLGTNCRPASDPEVAQEIRCDFAVPFIGWSRG